MHTRIYTHTHKHARTHNTHIHAYKSYICSPKNACKARSCSFHCYVYPLKLEYLCTFMQYATCTCMHCDTHACSYTHIHTYMHTYMHIHICTCARAQAHAHICMLTLSHTHTHACTHTHTHKTYTSYSHAVGLLFEIDVSN